MSVCLERGLATLPCLPLMVLRFGETDYRIGPEASEASASEQEDQGEDGQDYHPLAGSHVIECVKHYRSFSAEAREGDEAEQKSPGSVIGHSEEVSDCRGESCHDIPFHLKYTIQWF